MLRLWAVLPSRASLTSKCLFYDLQGSNDLQLERMNVYFNEASGGESCQVTAEHANLQAPAASHSLAAAWGW